MLMDDSFLIAECLTDLGFIALAKESLETQNGEVLKGYLKLINEEIQKTGRDDIAERLQFRGLLNG